MKNDIRPEDLGEMGQSYFKMLLKSVGWIVNDSNDDKAGWDFEIEPVSPSAIDYSTHSRSVYRVQVKSTCSKNAKVQLTYSNLLNLIRFGAPSYIVLFKYENGEIPTQCYVLHISREFSENVLKSLRTREISKDGVVLNKNTKVVNFESSPMITPPDGQGLLNLLNEHVESSYLDYCKAKIEWLEQFQKESGKRLFKLSFSDEASVIAMANRLIGLDAKANVKVKAYVAPFGIEDPKSLVESSEVDLQISPNEELLPKSKIRLSRSKHSKRFEFQCVVLTTPNIFPKEYRAIRFKSALLSFILLPGSLQPQFVTENLFDASLSAPFREFYELFSYLSEIREGGEVYFEAGPNESGKFVNLTTRASKPELPDDFDDHYSALGASFKKLAELGLADYQFRPLSFFQHFGSFQIFQLFDREFSEPTLLKFQSEETNPERVDVVIFTNSISFVEETVLFFSAFFGKVSHIENHEFHIEYNKTEFLDFLVAPNDEDFKKLNQEKSAVLREELESRGFTVLV